MSKLTYKLNLWNRLVKLKNRVADENVLKQVTAYLLALEYGQMRNEECLQCDYFLGKFNC